MPVCMSGMAVRWLGAGQWTRSVHNSRREAAEQTCWHWTAAALGRLPLLGCLLPVGAFAGPAEVLAGGGAAGPARAENSSLTALHCVPPCTPTPNRRSSAGWLRSCWSCRRRQTSWESVCTTCAGWVLLAAGWVLLASRTQLLWACSRAWQRCSLALPDGLPVMWASQPAPCRYVPG